MSLPVEDQKEDPVLLAAKLPLSDRILHKHWKVREKAYADLSDKFNVAPEDDKIYSDYLSSLVKIARDANAPAQLSGYGALSKYADTAPPALIRRVTSEIVKAIVEKGLAGRPTNKTKALEVFLMLIGADAGDLAVESMATNGFKHRTPKVVAASIGCLVTAVDTYGTRAVPVKPIAAKLGPCLDHAQEIVRNQAKTLVVHLNRWVGSAIKPVLKQAKDVIQKEMEKIFAENAKLPKPTPKQLTRAMQNRARRTGADDDDGDDGFGEGYEEEEELDLAEEINLIEKLATVKIDVGDGVLKDWYAALDSKKWGVRKKTFDEAIAIVGDARLTPASHQDIVIKIRKVFAKDSNINVVASAAKLLKAMAGGLKKNFPPHFAKALFVDLLGRLKEKNRIGTEAVSSALDAFHQMKCLRVVDMLEEITTASQHKTPKARLELFLFLSRCLLNGIAGIDLKGAPLKCFGMLCVKGSEDSAPEVRDAALGCLAALQKLVGDRNVAAFLDKLDKKRKDKVNAMGVKLPDPPKVASSKTKNGPSSNTRAQKKNRASEGKSPSKAALPAKATSPAKRKKPKKPVMEGSDDEGESPLSPNDALEAAAKQFEGFEPENWSIKSFKKRAAAAAVVTAALGKKDKLTDEEVSLVLSLLQNEPGLADSNFIAAKPKLELFAMVADKCASPPPRKTLKPLLICAVEKLGELKASKMTAGILMSFAEATSPRYFFEILVQSARDTKNSRALIGMLKFATTMVEDFGIPPVPEKEVASLAASTLGSPAPAAKSSAAALACKSASRVGNDKFRAMLEELGAASDALELFDSELPKYTRPPDPPTRKKRFQAEPAPEEGGSDSDEVQSEPEPKPEPEPAIVAEPDPKPGPDPKPTPRLVSRPPRRVRPAVAKERKSPTNNSPKQAQRNPSGAPERMSVAAQFATGALIYTDLKSSNWRKRQEALEQIQTILADANDCITPNVGEIVHALRARLGDSNRNLALLAYRVVSRLSRAMGPNGVVHLKNFAADVLGKGCVDIKKNVREAAVGCATTWFEVYGLAHLIPFCDRPLASLNSMVRKEFLQWIVPRLQGEVGQFDPSQEDLSPMIDPCLTCLRDRIAEVRRLADMALEQIVRSVGMNTVDGKVAMLSKSARLQLEPILDKYRGAGQDKGELAVIGVRAGKAPTPRSGRQRPQSVALPRTPLHKRGLPGPEVVTPGTGRRQRAASVRVTPVAGSMRSELQPHPRLPVLKQNDGHAMRLKRYVSKRKFVLEELSGSNPPEEILPLIGEELHDLAGDVGECCSEELCTKLMAPANRFRMHVEAIGLVREQLEQNPDSLLSCADVLLRWAACRIEDSKTPPTVLVKLASFVSTMCEVLMSSDVKLGEYEASAILPPIIAKSGSNRASVRDAMRSASLSVSDIIDDEVRIVLLTSCLRQPESTRANTEISEEICRLIDKRCNAGAGIPMGVLPTIGRIAGGEDDIAGKAAATCLERAHEYFGDDLWPLVGELTNEQAAFLDDRLTNVINGMRHEAVGEEASNEHTSTDITALSAGEPEQVPVDIKNEDFRLSVAPAPPSSVLTSISDSLNMSTPVKTRNREFIPQTPALPLKQKQRETIAAENRVFSDVLIRLQSSDRDAQLSGLASVFEDLKRDGALLRNTNGWKMLLQLVKCFVETLDRLMNKTPLEDDPAVLKSFLKGVIRFARESELLRQLDQMSVQSLLSDALDAMIPQAVDGVDDWDQVRRGVNLMIVKVLELCDQNLLFTAMINLLLLNIRIMQRQPGEKMMALAKSSICIKSIAKVVKRGFSGCRVNALLRDIHLFLMANPVRKDSMSSAEDQTFAMRLLKTVVNAIIDEMGEEIRLKMDLIPQPDKSQLVQYVEMTLHGRGDQMTGQSPGSNILSPEQRALHDIESMGNQKIHDLLSRMDITVDSEGDLHTLRAVLIYHPDIDIDVHLEKYPIALREFVSEGLKRLKEDSETQIEESASPESLSKQGHMGVGGLSNMSSQNNSSGTAGQVYLKRLHEIQLRYGLQTGRRPAGDGENGSEVGEKENGNGSLERVTSGEDAAGKASSLRERMARIRELQTAAKR